MGKFNNDLSIYLDIIQMEEISESHLNYQKRFSKRVAITAGLLTGAIVATTRVVSQSAEPSLAPLSFISIPVSFLLINKAMEQYVPKKYRLCTKDVMEHNPRILFRKERERARYQGKLKLQSPYRYELPNKEEIAEYFGFEGDNNLPVQFLPIEEVPEQVLHEYDCYAKRYEVPELNISEDEMREFVNKLSELLKKVNLSHRIYFYTSEYFKRITSKGIINYWDSISLDTLLNEIEVFENLEIPKEDIEAFKSSFKNISKIKKL